MFLSLNPAPRLAIEVGCQHSDARTQAVDPTVENGGMSSRGEPLVQFIAERVREGGRNAKRGVAGSPEPLLIAARTGIEQQSENAVFGDVGQLAQHDVKQFKCLRRQAQVNQSETQREQPP